MNRFQYIRLLVVLSLLASSCRADSLINTQALTLPSWGSSGISSITSAKLRQQAFSVLETFLDSDRSHWLRHLPVSLHLTGLTASILLIQPGNLLSMIGAISPALVFLPTFSQPLISHMGYGPAVLSWMDPVRDLMEWKIVQEWYRTWMSRLAWRTGQAAVTIEMIYPSHFAIPEHRGHDHFPEQRVNRLIAARQYETFVQSLMNLGVKVDLKEAPRERPGAVFIEQDPEKRLPLDPVSDRALKRLGIEQNDHIISIGSTILLTKPDSDLSARLARQGFRVIETPLTEFEKAGGQARMLFRLRERHHLFPHPITIDSHRTGMDAPSQRLHLSGRITGDPIPGRSVWVRIASLRSHQVESRPANYNAATGHWEFESQTTWPPGDELTITTSMGAFQAQVVMRVGVADSVYRHPALGHAS